MEVVMKILTLLLISAFFILPLPVAASDPVVEINCQPGGEYGNIINLKLSKDSHYGTLIIKRKNANADHSRDLSGFSGGNYKLDLSTRGGITGYAIEYATKDSTEMVTAEGSITCAALDTIPTDVSEPPTVPPPSTTTAPAPETNTE